jgi:hypothetical protein
MSQVLGIPKSSHSQCNVSQNSISSNKSVDLDTNEALGLRAEIQNTSDPEHTERGSQRHHPRDLMLNYYRMQTGNKETRLTSGDSSKKKWNIRERTKHMKGPVNFGRARGYLWQIAVAAKPTTAANKIIGNNVEIVMYKNVTQYATM